MLIVTALMAVTLFAPLAWFAGEAGEFVGEILDPVELGRIGNPFGGAATAAGAAAVPLARLECDRARVCVSRRGCPDPFYPRQLPTP